MIKKIIVEKPTEREKPVSTAECRERRRGRNHGRGRNPWEMKPREGKRRRDEEMKRGESMGDEEREIVSSRHTWR